MPTTVTSNTNTQYHLWQLHADCAKEISPGIKFNEIRNPLGNGYRSQALYGSDTGTRMWNITLPTLAGSDVAVPTVTSINGETVSREQYIWELYCESRITGTPFAFTCPRDGIPYLVDFVDDSLSYEKQFRVALYSTGIKLEQVRIKGETIFNLDPFYQSGSFQNYDQAGHSAPSWYESSGSGVTVLTDTLGTASFDATTQNGLNIVRIGSSATRLTSDMTPVCDLICVMKIRESTFSNAGVLIGTSTTGKIKGTSAGTKWQNPSHSGLRYWLNGREYAVTNMQAPMNTWGIVRVRSATPLVASPNAACIGAEGSSNGLKADIGEIVISANPLTVQFGRQITEHLAVKWAIGY